MIHFLTFLIYITEWMDCKTFVAFTHLLRKECAKVRKKFEISRKKRAKNFFRARIAGVWREGQTVRKAPFGFRAALGPQTRRQSALIFGRLPKPMPFFVAGHGQF
ncbi:hypothetical protein [Pseudoramibacter faecis]|uniref:hypothetical protein n=1 Tax=Pseudoramibacter faecis TaxID=3108534 RepID=UPI002E75E6B3|nr:hypothetical protein [Pseudoramibacter sp. HA2172]